MFALALALALFESKPACPMVSNVQTSPDKALTGALIWKPNRAVYNNDELFPQAIVLLKGGAYWKEIPSRVVFIWQWTFWNDGKQIAIDDSPLHYVQDFDLIDLKSSRVLQSDSSEPGHILSPWAQVLANQEALDAKQEVKPHADCRFQPPAKP